MEKQTERTSLDLKIENLEEILPDKVVSLARIHADHVFMRHRGLYFKEVYHESLIGAQYRMEKRNLSYQTMQQRSQVEPLYLDAIR